MMIRKAKLTEREQDIVRVARSVIRDQAHGWQTAELAKDPRLVCEWLSQLVGETYDYEIGGCDDDQH